MIFTGDTSIDNILEEQYILAKKSHISFSDTEYMPDFERQIVFGKLARDLKAEAEEYKKAGRNR